MTPIVQALWSGQLDSTTDQQPDPIPLRTKDLARYVGLTAFFLPVVLYLGAALEPFCRPSSISHSYYIPFLGSFFVAAMGFIAVFLFCYPGHSAMDSRMATIAGGGALGLAIFPTAGDGCAESFYSGRVLVAYSAGEGDAITPALSYDYTLIGRLTSQMLHFGFAGLLFGILAYFALWSFRRNNGEGVLRGPDGQPQMTEVKRFRNRIYLICGLVIVGCIVVIAFLPNTSDGVSDLFPPVFTVEAIALFAFGISWAVKGRIFAAVREDQAPRAVPAA